MITPTKQSTFIQAVREVMERNSQLPERMTPEELQLEILRLIYCRIELHNTMCGKDEKWRKPEDLPLVCIAEILKALYIWRNIAYGDSDSGHLAVYHADGPKAGLYVDMDDGDLMGPLIRQYCPGVTVREKTEIISMLKDAAEKVLLTKDGKSPDLIAVNNGIFDYSNKRLLPFSPDQVFVTKCPVDYVPGAQPPVIQNPDGTSWDPESWMQSLSDDPEIVNLLWEILGAVIRPYVPWGKGIFFYADDGSNGKGTLCELMRELCGKGAYKSVEIKSLNDRFSLSNLEKVTAIITDENSTERFSSVATAMKAIITGDVLQVDRKYKDPINCVFDGLMVQCINEKPKFRDQSQSLYRRLLFVPFTKTFQGQERKYIKEDYIRRKDVLEYVLWRVLNMNYYAFSNPAACEAFLAEYKSHNDIVRQFLDDILPELKWDLVPWQFLYDLYAAWIRRYAPGAATQDRATFIDSVRKVMDDPTTSIGWIYAKNPVSVTNTNMQELEPLILEYQLGHWMAPRYSGNNPDQMCQPKLNRTYRGIVRV